MYTRHNEVPVLYQWPDTMDASHYNRVQLALRHLGEGVRLQLPGLKTLELILQSDAWIVVDRAFNDVPVAAWVEFEATERSSLQEPVKCQLRYYHAHAAIVIKQVLALMDELLDRQLAELLEEESANASVLPFKKKD